MENDVWNVPATAEEVAGKVAELGPPQAEFAMTTAGLVGQIFRAVMLAPVGLILIGLPLLLLWADGAGHGWFLVFKLGVLGVIFLAGSVLVARRALRNRGLRVLVYPEGLVRLHREGNQAVFWDEVELLLQRRPPNAWARLSQGKLILIIKRRDGDEITVDDSLPDLPRLVTVAQRETLGPMLARALAALEAGRVVSFGRLSASPRGLSNGQETLPWALVRPPRLEADRFFIDRSGHWLPWHAGAVSETPNFHVLQALIREQTAARRP